MLAKRYGMPGKGPSSSAAKALAIIEHDDGGISETILSFLIECEETLWRVESRETDRVCGSWSVH